MSHPSVVHCKRSEFDVYVGRKRHGIGWGNPYPVSEFGVDAMRLYLDCLAERPWLVERARRQLAGKILGCWCAPGPCHGDVLARLADGEELELIREDVLKSIHGDHGGSRPAGGGGDSVQGGGTPSCEVSSKRRRPRAFSPQRNLFE